MYNHVFESLSRIPCALCIIIKWLDPLPKIDWSIDHFQRGRAMSLNTSCHGRGSILRRLEHKDIAQIKGLCSDCFPIEYSDHWFDYVTSTKVSIKIIM